MEASTCVAILPFGIHVQLNSGGGKGVRMRGFLNSCKENTIKGRLNATKFGGVYDLLSNMSTSSVLPKSDLRGGKLAFKFLPFKNQPGENSEC